MEYLEIISKNEGKSGFEEIGRSGDVYLYKFVYSSIEKKVPSQISVRWRIPSVGAFSTWNPSIRFNRALRTINTAGIRAEASICDGAPMQTLIGQNGKNLITFAVSDTITPIRTNTQIYEEGMGMTCEVVFFTKPVRTMDYYEAIVRIDFSDVPYYEAIADVGKWWREDCGYAECYVPEFAKDILYSTWYSYHHDVSDSVIVEQCKLAHSMGMNNIILDDGWNMSDREHRGFGDWIVQNPNIKDMADLVAQVHEIGMKFILWLSVPFISKDAKLWERFGQYVLATEVKTPWYCLDPRYKEVREYTISVYERVVSEWNLDGLKLDFINSFQLSDYSMQVDDRRDYECLEDAVAKLVEDISVRVRKIKPDIMIEFRQPYMSPKACGTGNMMRVSDCPNDALYNRVGSVDLRLLADKMAVHADMIGWNLEDSPEGVARQLIAVLFCVPQISVKLEEQNESQLKTLRFYMDFYTENRDVLLDGEFIPLNPEANYAVVIGEKNHKRVTVCYSKNYIKSSKNYNKHYIVNGTEEGKVILDNEGTTYAANIMIQDCMGNVLCERQEDIIKGINVFEVPACGIVRICSI